MNISGPFTGITSSGNTEMFMWRAFGMLPSRSRHAVVALPGAIVLVPLPQLAVEGGLRVDLELVHVDVLAEELLQRLDQAWVPAENAERLVVGVGGERRARRTRLFAPDLLAL